MKMYLLKSDDNRQEVADVIINLEKVLVIKAAEVEDCFVIAVEYTHEDAVKQRYKTKESCIAAMEDILRHMDADVRLAQEFVFADRKKPSEKMTALKNIAEALSKVTA